MTPESLKLLFLRGMSKSPWHCLKKAFDELDEETFLWRPPKHTGFPWMNGSIQDILFHVTGDKIVQLSQAFGDGSQTWDNLEISKGSLLEMWADLEKAQLDVIRAVESQTEESLTAKVKIWGGSSLGCEDFFLMLAEHDFYHAGQVRYMRNIAPDRQVKYRPEAE
jgi:uncharacterized damage-inducible protein DinB